MEEVRGCLGALRYSFTGSCFHTKPYQGQKLSKTEGAIIFGILAKNTHCDTPSEDKDLLTKHKVKCDAVEELLKKQEKVSAQLRRKDWEIANYQKKLDTAFEAGMSIGGTEDRGKFHFLLFFRFTKICFGFRSTGKGGKWFKSARHRLASLGSLHPKEGGHQQQQADQDGEDDSRQERLRLCHSSDQEVQRAQRGLQ